MPTGERIERQTRIGFVGIQSQMMSLLRLWLPVGALLLLSYPAHAEFSVFTGLGELPGGPFASYARGVSADGSVVVGYSRSTSALETFRWTEAGGMVGLGHFAAPHYGSSAAAASAGGSVVVGHSYGTGLAEAYRWTQAGGMVGLGYLTGGSLSYAEGVSADGSVVVGNGDSTGGLCPLANCVLAYRWTQAGGMVDLGDLAGGSYFSRAEGVSADGSVVVGHSFSGGHCPTSNCAEGFRWTQAGGMVGLGDLAGGDFFSQANDVSADGSTVVGRGTSSGLNPEAFRWTQAGGMVGLGGFSGANSQSIARAVSADGSVVIGESSSDSTLQEVFIWNATDGMRELDQVLIDDHGLDLTGWKLQDAGGISDDGTVIVGFGENPDGETEAWLAVLGDGPAPVPSLNPVGIVLLSSLLGLEGIRRLCG